MMGRFARRLGSAPPSPPPPGPALGIPERKLVPPPVAPVGPVTEILFSRLTAEDLAEIEAQLDGLYRVAWDGASVEQRKRLALAFALHFGVADVPARTGLSATEPPEEIHSMVRNDVTQTGGSYYYADLVVECLERTGSPLAPGSHGLDFSCSSGRVVRPLAAALPDVHWHGCDPNAGAIGWARDHAPGIEFFVSDTSPPLPFSDGSLDLAFAISVWSHYSEAAALSWLAEMQRVIRPGGRLILTTHGLQSCVWFTHFRDQWIEARLGADWIVQTAHQLELAGHSFWDVFGKAGDWGVVDREWGLAFFTPEWLLQSTSPRWALVDYAIGRADGNQDVYALERR
jgi:SAM-dependent methyltransferase